jgi:NitT/TauT family transport system substrate-binding protein
MRRRDLIATGAAALALPGIARAQAMPKIVIGMSGWTGFAPLTLAEQAGLFKANGLDVETRFVPQSGRNLALASGALNCVVTTVDTMITWASAGLPLTQVLVLDRSKGGDGIAGKPSIGDIKGLKGKTVAVDGAGTTPYFMLAYVLRKNGLSVKDLTTVTLAPQPAAQAFVAGQVDACSTYEPYLSQVRALGADKGKILATTLDYPVVVDTLALQPDFIAKNPGVAPALVRSWYAALDMITREPEKSFEIMGKRVNQDAAAFKGSAEFIEWQDKARNEALSKGPLRTFMDEAAVVLKETGVIRTEPDLGKLYSAAFLG